MNPTIRRLALIFLALFAVINVVMLVWQWGWVSPQKRCEAERNWWDGAHRVCAHPIPISDITGRLIADDQSRAAAKADAAQARQAQPTP
jgi:hypothetical protein